MAAPLAHVTLQPPASQSTLQDLALLQSTVHAPVHSMAQELALLQSTFEPVPTTARQAPLFELQSSEQPAPQLAPHVDAELQSTLQPAPHDAAHDCGSLLQSTWHDDATPQSTEHGAVLSHWQLAPAHVPDVVDGMAAPDGGGGAPTAFGTPLLLDDPPQATATTTAAATANERATITMSPPARAQRLPASSLRSDANANWKRNR
jgi:hypothetical protein